MKCQKLLITSLVALSLTIPTYQPTFACSSGSQQDTGESDSDKGDSNGSKDSGPSKGQDSSSTDSANGDRDSNTPVFRGPCGDWLIFGDTDWCQDIRKD